MLIKYRSGWQGELPVQIGRYVYGTLVINVMFSNHVSFLTLPPLKILRMYGHTDVYRSIQAHYRITRPDTPVNNVHGKNGSLLS